MSTLTNRSLRAARKAERMAGAGLAVAEPDLSALLRALAPWLIMAGTFIAAPLARWFAEAKQVTTLAGWCFAASTVVLTGLSLHLTRERKPLGRLHEAVNTAAPLSLVTYTIGYGITIQVMLPAAVLGLTTCILWNRRHVRHSMGEVAVQHGGGRSEWEAFTREHLPQLHGSRLQVLRDDSEEFVAGLKLGEAGLPSDVGGVLDRLTRYAGGMRGGADLITGDFLDKVLVHVMRKDPLRTPFDWQGPSAPGESIAEPIEGLGRYRNKRDLTMLLPHRVFPGGEVKVQAHMLSFGMSRAGKDAAGETIDVNVATRRDAAVVFCDPVKADQSTGPIGEGAVYILDSPAKIKAFFHRLVHKTIPDRAAYLGNPSRNRLGKICREWEPGCGLTWILVHVVEAAALYNNEAMTQITERAASVGIMLHLALQKGIHDRLDTNARSNTGAGLAFGCYNEDDAALVLASELLELGVNPGAWKNNHPGMCYYQAPGIALAQQTVPARFGRHADDGSTVIAALREYMHLAEPLDPITAASWGEPFAKYRAERAAGQGRSSQHAVAGAASLDRRVVQARAEVIAQEPAPRPHAPLVVTSESAAAGDEPGDDDDPTPEEVQAQRELAAEDVITEMINLMGDDPDARHVVDGAIDALAAPLEEGDEAPFVRNDAADVEFPRDPDLPPPSKPPIASKDEAIDVLLDIVDGIGTGNECGPKDLYSGVEDRAGKGESWVRSTLPLLLAWGCLEATGHGRYAIIHTRRGDREYYGQ